MASRFLSPPPQKSQGHRRSHRQKGLSETLDSLASRPCTALSVAPALRRRQDQGRQKPGFVTGRSLSCFQISERASPTLKCALPSPRTFHRGRDSECFYGHATRHGALLSSCFERTWAEGAHHIVYTSQERGGGIDPAREACANFNAPVFATVASRFLSRLLPSPFSSYLLDRSGFFAGLR